MQFGPNWDLHLQQLLFAYTMRPHESTCESPFFLLYGRDARLPTESTLEALSSLYREDTETYGEELEEDLRGPGRMLGMQSRGPRSTRSISIGGRKVMVYVPVEALITLVSCEIWRDISRAEGKSPYLMLTRVISLTYYSKFPKDYLCKTSGKNVCSGARYGCDGNDEGNHSYVILN